MFLPKTEGATGINWSMGELPSPPLRSRCGPTTCRSCRATASPLKGTSKTLRGGNTSGPECSWIKPGTDQGCPCGGERSIVVLPPCTDPFGSCSTIEHRPKTCVADGVGFTCEESFMGTPCDVPPPPPPPTPEPTPPGCGGLCKPNPACVCT